jgi:hypothetical protein
MITELTAQQWLRLKLRYECKEVKKGVYDSYPVIDLSNPTPFIPGFA